MRSVYDAFEAGDAGPLLAQMTADTVWHFPGDNPMGGTFRGLDEIRTRIRPVPEDGEPLHFEVHDIASSGRHVVVLFHLTGRRDGKSLDVGAGHLLHVYGEGNVAEGWTIVENVSTFDEFWA